MRTRRELLTAGAAALAAGLARPRSATADAGEAAAVRELILLEDAAAAAYERAADTTRDGLLARIGAQDVQHAHALRVVLESLTVPPPHHAPGAERRDPLAARLAEAGARADALEAAIELEGRLQRAYVAAAARVVHPRGLTTVAAVLGGHAQQVAVLRAAAGRRALAEPYLVPS